MGSPKTLLEAIQYFSDEQLSIDTVFEMRWPDGPMCPECGTENPYYIETQKRWKCRECRIQFSVNKQLTYAELTGKLERPQEPNPYRGKRGRSPTLSTVKNPK